MLYFLKFRFVLNYSFILVNILSFSFFMNLKVNVWFFWYVLVYFDYVYICKNLGVIKDF